MRHRHWARGRFNSCLAFRMWGLLSDSGVRESASSRRRLRMWSLYCGVVFVLVTGNMNDALSPAGRGFTTGLILSAWILGAALLPWTIQGETASRERIGFNADWR